MNDAYLQAGLEPKVLRKKRCKTLASPKSLALIATASPPGSRVLGKFGSFGFFLLEPEIYGYIGEM
jgi:hypothetical protein